MWPLFAQNRVAGDLNGRRSQRGAPRRSGHRWLCYGDKAASLLSFPAAGLHLLVLPNLASDEREQREIGLWGSHAPTHASLFPGTPAPKSASVTGRQKELFPCASSYTQSDSSLRGLPTSTGQRSVRPEYHMV